MFLTNIVAAQTVTINGQVTAEDDLENIHVLNKTSFTNATTDSTGHFKIKVKLHDTIVFSAVQYQILIKVISEENIKNKSLTAQLELYTNNLDEVFLTKQLTGNLLDDVAASDAEPELNFYDVGIPGYTGKPLTQSENRLHEAGEFKPKMLLGVLTGSIPLNPILNGISGRTKELKERVRLENNDVLLARLKNDLAEDFFKEYPLDEDKRDEFFYFCQEDENFHTNCSKSNLEALQFFKNKYTIFIKNQKETKKQ